MKIKDPIKPKLTLTKKPNFKKEKLERNGGPVVFVSPGVFTREVDVSSWDVSSVTTMESMFQNTTFNQDIFIPQREPQEPNNNGRIYNIEVGNTDGLDMDHFVQQMQRSLMVPATYFNNQGDAGPTQIQSERDLTRTFGELVHPDGLPISISSRQRQNTDGSLDLLGFDMVAGGEEMMYNATTTMLLSPPREKKSIVTKMKDYFLNIYRKWKRVA